MTAGKPEGAAASGPCGRGQLPEGGLESRTRREDDVMAGTRRGLPALHSPRRPVSACSAHRATATEPHPRSPPPPRTGRRHSSARWGKRRAGRASASQAQQQHSHPWGVQSPVRAPRVVFRGRSSGESVCKRWQKMSLSVQLQTEPVAVTKAICCANTGPPGRACCHHPCHLRNGWCFLPAALSLHAVPVLLLLHLEQGAQEQERDVKAPRSRSGT